MKKVIIAVTGASGAIYSKLLINNLKNYIDQFDECCVVFSDNAKEVWKLELGNDDYNKIPFKTYQINDFNSPAASGSSGFDTMIVCPCTMATLGKIANGINTDLITRAADVILKERGRLILVTREMPLNLIHLNNMKTLTEAGGIICHASPSFYSKPITIEDVAMTVIEKVLKVAGFEGNFYKWGEKE